MARDYAAIIAALLAHAEDEANSDVARQSYRDKAEQMMREYRIAEEEALATDPGSALPILRSVTIPAGSMGATYFPALVRTIAEHAEVQVRVRTSYERDTYRRLVNIDWVGYEGDVRYAEFLWTSTYLMFSTRIDPTWSDDLSEADNIYRLRQAGIERRAIADRAWGPGSGDQANLRSKVQSIYKREAAKRGEVAVASGLGFNTKLYRDAYARQFWSTLHTRLWSARHAANAAGGVVTLANRKERVQEAFYGFFPTLRPTSEVMEPYVDPNADCDRCKRAKSGFCRAHDYLKPRQATQADQKRWDRADNSAAARAGQASGASAARGVHISRGTAETGKMGSAAQRALD